MVAYIKVPNATARSMAAQVASEVEDHEFEKLFTRIVRDAKHRRHVDFQKLLKIAERAWAVEKNKTANCDWEP